MRTLPVRYEASGERYRLFTDAVSGMLEEPELRGVLESMGPEWSSEAKFKKVSMN